MSARALRALLTVSHDDTPIKIKIGNTLYDIREFRQVTDATVSNSVMKVLVPIDIHLLTE